MRDVRSGLAGMLILVWVIIATILTRDSLHYKEIDFDKYPYHKMFKFISVIGIIHVSFAAYFIQSSIAYLVILILTVTSFIFSVDLYTVITTIIHVSKTLSL
ncbi:Protein CBG21185 [Caenorhabditis briggsae]|uniref:Protein CBG21185 n=1 Tax=Caenorhabditis briggsae TaxID=6238 RepID=A8XZN5_CAEBR|nr:Protein CBG21185 [Caenorhabditis briggsae]CAP38034.2 Protein CBG21185 [Caenorhabditis briggsae]